MPTARMAATPRNAVRYKTRSGDTVRLVDLLDVAGERMKKELLERIREGKSPLSEEQAAHASRVIG